LSGAHVATRAARHDASAGSTPPLSRRLACFVYEGVMLFGIVMACGLVYGMLTQQHDARSGRAGLQTVLFIALALYFVGFWSHGGQTLAMKTWHIRLLDRCGQPVRPLRALARYLLAWLWFLPALLLLAGQGLHESRGLAAGGLAAGVLAYAALSRLLPQRQYLHDLLCGTRLVNCRPASKH
jgi:uncharacterized RDD family membrane protein YckC